MREGLRNLPLLENYYLDDRVSSLLLDVKIKLLK